MWLLALDACDGYVVLITNPETGETDAHGPFDGLGATLAADSFRRDLDGDDLLDVEVQVIRLHQLARPRAR